MTGWKINRRCKFESADRSFNGNSVYCIPLAVVKKSGALSATIFDVGTIYESMMILETAINHESPMPREFVNGK